MQNLSASPYIEKTSDECTESTTLVWHSNLSGPLTQCWSWWQTPRAAPDEVLPEEALHIWLMPMDAWLNSTKAKVCSYLNVGLLPWGSCDHATSDSTQSCHVGMAIHRMLTFVVVDVTSLFGTLIVWDQGGYWEGRVLTWGPLWLT